MMKAPLPLLRGRPGRRGKRSSLKARVAPHEPELEVERYELREGPAYHFTWRRREFFKALGCGLVVFLVVKPAFAQESGGGGRRGGGGRNRPQEIGAWLHIGEDGTVTVFTGKAEVGQN